MVGGFARSLRREVKMQKFSTLPDAVALATFAHRNQFDKAGLPYIDHPLRVLETVKAMGGKPYVQMAAVLHDVVEDTAFTLVMLQDLGFSPAVTELVRLLTRLDSVPKEVYYHNIRSNPDAVMIKTADIRDNTAPWRLSYLPEETQDRLTLKYAIALDSIGAV
jgi:(p)ppGpp synthase/HD superfamily hydrolase